MSDETYKLVLLKRIADTLDLPISCLFINDKKKRTLEAQTTELIAIFHSIHDSATRELCLDFARMIVRNENPNTHSIQSNK